GCDVIEDDHHIFVTCTRYTEWRIKAAAELHKRTNAKLAEKKIEESDRFGLLTTVTSLFSDHDTASVWPLQYITYYLGHIPIFDHLIPRSAALPDKLTHTWLAHHLAADWHTASLGSREESGVIGNEK
ncbi:hypothetical protein DFH09DRAFT_906233, partial [Mycena vulgaris]